MKRSLVVELTSVLWLTLSLLFVPCSCTAEDEQKVEAQRIAEIAKKLEVSKPLPGEKSDPERTKFCRRLLEDLRTQRTIEFVKPLVHTDKYDDPQLQAYLGKCPNLKLDRTVSYEPRVWEFAKTLPEDQREELGTVWIRSADFRLYELFGPKTQGKPFYVFYGGGSYSPRSSGVKKSANLSQYVALDLGRCSAVDTRQVGETIDFETKRPTGNLNGVVRCREELYLYNALWFPAQGRYSMQLYSIDGPEKIPQILKACSFMATEEMTGGEK